MTYYESKPSSDHAMLDGGTDRYDRVRNAVVRAVHSTGFSVLDVGAAGGGHLARYGPSVQKFAVEPARSARPLLKGRGIDWLGSTLADVPDGMYFDVVTCMDVLEHVEDPRQLLEDITKVVASDGIVALVTGDLRSMSARLGGRRWEYLSLPEHCSFVSREALDDALERYGFCLHRSTWIANEDIRARYIARFVKGVVREGVVRLIPPRQRSALEWEGRVRFPFFCDNMLLIYARNRGPLDGDR